MLVDLFILLYQILCIGNRFETKNKEKLFQTDKENYGSEPPKKKA